MTPQKASELQEGQRVIWTPTKAKGVVTCTINPHNEVWIKWENEEYAKAHKIGWETDSVAKN